MYIDTDWVVTAAETRASLKGHFYSRGGYLKFKLVLLQLKLKRNY